MAAQTSDRGERVRGWITVIVSVATVLVAGLVYLNQRDIQEKQTTLAGQQQDLAENQGELERQVAEADRFNTLATQLASDRSIERIASMYGFLDLANDEGVTQTRVLRVLAAYLPRTGTPPPSAIEVAVGAGTLASISQLIHARDHGRLDLAFDLAHVELPDHDLPRLHADRAYFYSANFLKSNLRESAIRCTDLTLADFREAHLEGARLDEVLIDGAEFSGVVVDESTRVGKVYWETPPVGASELGGTHSGGAEDFRRACEL